MTSVTILFATRILLIVFGILFGVLLLTLKNRIVYLNEAVRRQNHSLQILFKILIYISAIASFIGSLTLALTIFGII